MKFILLIFCFIAFHDFCCAEEIPYTVEVDRLKEKLASQAKEYKTRCPKLSVLTSVTYKNEADKAYYAYAIPELTKLIEHALIKVNLPDIKMRVGFHINYSGLIEKVDLLSIDRKDYESELLTGLNKISGSLRKTELGECGKYLIIATLTYERSSNPTPNQK